MPAIVKKCITCDGEGHTYLECPRVPFGVIMGGALGAPIADRERWADELQNIDAERFARANVSTETEK